MILFTQETKINKKKKNFIYAYNKLLDFQQFGHISLCYNLQNLEQPLLIDFTIQENLSM